ncbi:MAG: lipopolysaccharide biosynthesis protein [Acidobacteriota bacterium]
MNLAFSIIIRRTFGTLSGAYDVVLGLSASLLSYSSLGIPTSMTKLLPEIEARSGPSAISSFLARASLLRMLPLALALVLLNLFAGELSRWLGLGHAGLVYLRLLTALVIARALLELAIKTLNAFFAQLTANLITLAQAVLDFSLVGLVLLLGYGIGGVLGALAVSSALLALIGSGSARRTIHRLGSPEHLTAPEVEPNVPRSMEAVHFARFTGFTYLYELSLYFAGMGFASPALAALLGVEQVALFATGFKLALMAVVLVVSPFRGVYRPLFARLRERGDLSQLQRAFAAVSKAQIVLLLPSAVGLVVMADDYLPLLYGSQFLPAVPIARLLVALLFAETAFNLAMIVLWIDERYWAMAGSQAILVLAAPCFLIAAARGGLLAAAAVFGGARLAVSASAYLVCRRAYRFHYPWPFAARVGAASLIMGAVLLTAKAFWRSSVGEALTLTLLGIAVFGLCLRLMDILGADETELLCRAQLPGQRWILGWLTPRT